MWRHLPNMKWTHKQQDKAGIWCGSCANQQALAVVIIPLFSKMNKYIWATSCPHIDDKLRTSSDKFVSPAHMMTSSCVSADIAILEHSFAHGSWVLQISTVQQPSSCVRGVRHFRGIDHHRAVTICIHWQILSGSQQFWKLIAKQEAVKLLLWNHQ